MIDARKMPIDIFSPLTITVVSEEKLVGNENVNVAKRLNQTIVDVLEKRELKCKRHNVSLKSSKYSHDKYLCIRDAIQMANIIIFNNIKTPEAIRDLMNRKNPADVRIDKKFIVISSKMSIDFAQSILYAGADFCMSSADITPGNLEEMMSNLIDSITLQAQFIGK